MTRPALPKLKRGDTLWMSNKWSHRERGRTYIEVRVVSIGPKFVGVVPAERYDAYLGRGGKDSYVRKFLLEDQTEGDRGTRIGYPAVIASAEQREYDNLMRRALTYLRDVVGVEITRHSPLRDDEVARKVADLLEAAESSWLPPL